MGIRLSQQVSFTGSPQLALTIGTSTRQATTYQDVSLMDFRSFYYTVQRDDLDTDGIGIAANALALNGGTIRSADGEDAILDLGTHAIGNDPDRKIDGSEGTEPPAPPEPDCSMQIQGDGYTVCYVKGGEADAEYARDVLNRATVRFRTRYGPSSTAVVVKLYAEPGEYARRGRATARGNREMITVHHMAKSAPSMNFCCNTLGLHYQSDAYHTKILSHELSTAYQHHFSAYRSKPSWFQQGLQEYEGVYLVGSADLWRVSAEKVYADNSITCGAGLSGEVLTFAEPYAAGSVFFRYLADRFGEKIHIDMIRDGRANASQILADLTGETPCETFDHFRNWMYEQYGLGEP